MDSGSDRQVDRRPPRVRSSEPVYTGGYFDPAGDEWGCIAYGAPHFAITLTNGYTEAYTTTHGPTCAKCRTHLDSVLQARQSEERT